MCRKFPCRVSCLNRWVGLRHYIQKRRSLVELCLYMRSVIKFERNLFVAPRWRNMCRRHELQGFPYSRQLSLYKNCKFNLFIIQQMLSETGRWKMCSTSSMNTIYKPMFRRQFKITVNNDFENVVNNREIKHNLY
jgi:hypothetical protein